MTQNKRDYSYCGPKDDSKGARNYSYYGLQVERQSHSPSPTFLLPEAKVVLSNTTPRQENHDTTPASSDPPTTWQENGNAPALSTTTTWQENGNAPALSTTTTQQENGNAPALSTTTTQQDNGDTTPKQDNHDASSDTTIQHEDDNAPVVVA